MLGWGANPQDAPLWLAGAALLAGLALVLLTRWILGTAVSLGAMRDAGPSAWLRLLVSGAASLLMLSIMIRVIGSWLGAGRYRGGMKVFYFLTDWIVEPIRRRLPPMGALDLSPVAAYFLIFLLREVLLSVLR